MMVTIPSESTKIKSKMKKRIYVDKVDVAVLDLHCEAAGEWKTLAAFSSLSSESGMYL